MTIDATIQRLTNDGEVVVQFLVDVIQGTNYNAPLGHRIKSAEWLSALGGFIPEDAIPKSATIRPRPKSETKQDKADKADKRDKPDKKPEVTEKQILHFDIARLIKQETNDGETVVEFLIRVISKIEKSGENFTPAARMRAARELLVRGFGSAIPGVSRILSGKTEALDSYLSKIVREYTDHGADSVRFLVKAMENKTPEVDSKGAQNPYPKFERQRKGKPAEGFTASQRVWAACELLRRAYDIRTDHITPDDIQAYRNAQTPAANPGRAASEQPAAAANIAATEKRHHDQKRADANRPAVKSDSAAHKAQKPASATEKRADANRPAAKSDSAAGKQPVVAQNIAASEKPAITAEQRDDDNQPAANSDSAPAAESRAARRRQKRANRKAQKRAANARPDTSARSVYPEDIANIEAYKKRLQSKSDAIRDAKLRNVDIRKIPELKRHITPEEVAAFQRQPGNLYNRTREMYKEKYGEYPFPDDIPPNARSP